MGACELCVRAGACVLVKGGKIGGARGGRDERVSGTIFSDRSYGRRGREGWWWGAALACCVVVFWVVLVGLTQHAAHFLAVAFDFDGLVCYPFVACDRTRGL